jgi:formate dehydrogenase subunit delta
MELHHLIKMANEIGGFFAQMPEREEALAAIAGHLRNFWEPRMRRELIEYAQRDGAELKELVRAAVLSLPVPPRAMEPR